jgi:hypothetical protein
MSNVKSKDLTLNHFFLSDPDLMKQIRRSKSFYAKGKQGMSFEAVFGESLHARKQRKR